MHLHLLIFQWPCMASGSQPAPTSLLATPSQKQDVTVVTTCDCWPPLHSEPQKPTGIYGKDSFPLSLNLWFSWRKESGLDLGLGCFCLSDFWLSVALWSIHFDFGGGRVGGERVRSLFQSPHVSLFSTVWQSKLMGSLLEVFLSLLAPTFVMLHSPQCPLGSQGLL